MMSKWSAKPADHKAVRLRNNQRRHRKRVKDQIAELESRLEETQLQLNEALARIVELSEELEQARRTRNGADEPLAREHSYHSIQVRESSKNLGCQDGRLVIQQEKGEANQQTSLAPNESIPMGSSAGNLAPILSTPWTSEITVPTFMLNYDAFIDSEDRGCHNLPLPEPGKSTIRCQDAYLTITQQNYKALDSSVIRGWLGPGFRGEISEGDGCRVDTDLLFTLLDFISSS
ncbi:hypothetical protein S40285_10532 [Stachybotrys chlorohalonatus IBT 40285]|uniref:BZIP domain-containing protein n=1 Tax=Stachybotrys chlorohalonatus (strain IBT 40285) TaxID=1283841 RepID=A0A084Q8W4_STAC4|nr:hypothetical protein S40285_10532 [Stachybotrys chlorohalonata IBT 40285]